MSEPGCLVVVAGLPGSGKTTEAKRLQAERLGVRFCPDEWMTALGVNLWDGDLRARVEGLQWDMALDVLRAGGTARCPAAAALASSLQRTDVCRGEKGTTLPRTARGTAWERVPAEMDFHGVLTWTSPERREPPHDPVDERTALQDRLDYHRTTLLMKCGGLTPHQLAQQSVSPSNLSLLGLVRHLSGVEAWFHAYDGRPDHQFFWNYVPGASDGFSGVSADRADDDLASYLASVERSRRAVRDLDLDEVVPGEHDTLRWIYLHMIEEYARHNGHADILRERIDGATGE